MKKARSSHALLSDDRLYLTRWNCYDLAGSSLARSVLLSLPNSTTLDASLPPALWCFGCPPSLTSCCISGRACNFRFRRSNHARVMIVRPATPNPTPMPALAPLVIPPVRGGSPSTGHLRSTKSPALVTGPRVILNHVLLATIISKLSE